VETWTELLKWTTKPGSVLSSPSSLLRTRAPRALLRLVLYFGAALSVVAIVQMYSAEGRVFWLFPTEYKSFVLGPFVYHKPVRRNSSS